MYENGNGNGKKEEEVEEVVMAGDLREIAKALGEALSLGQPTEPTDLGEGHNVTPAGPSDAIYRLAAVLQNECGVDSSGISGYIIALLFAWKHGDLAARIGAEMHAASKAACTCGGDHFEPALAIGNKVAAEFTDERGDWK